MGFKDVLTKIKDGTAKFTQTTSRFNSNSFTGNVNREVKDGDFSLGSYLNVDGIKCTGLIYGTAQEDYTFTAADIMGFEVNTDKKVEIGKGGNYYPAIRCNITFNDGKKAQVDILAEKFDGFKKIFKL